MFLWQIVMNNETDIDLLIPIPNAIVAVITVHRRAEIAPDVLPDPPARAPHDMASL